MSLTTKTPWQYYNKIFIHFIHTFYITCPLSSLELFCLLQTAPTKNFNVDLIENILAQKEGSGQKTH